MNLDPVVRHMILADEVTTDPADPHKVVVSGIVQTVRLLEPVELPAVIPQLCVLLFLCGGRGRGVGQIITRDAVTDRPVFGSPPTTITYPIDPLEVLPVVYRMWTCKVPRPGLYWTQFWHNGKPLAEQPLIVRE
jgi:hypothetical protein